MRLPSWLTLASSLAVGLACDYQCVFEAEGLILSSVLNATALAFSQCCTILNSTLPTKTHFAEDDAYEAQQLKYSSVEQRETKPACRVTPSSAEDMSFIVRTAVQNQCTFAVKSGGHMNWGGSNVGQAGFTIDLGRLDEVSVHEERGIVSIGSGCLWGEVYEALAPYNLTTVGGRGSKVGVGGFLLGGGISFLSTEHGLGSDNVVNYLVALADGAISNVNGTSLPDLYWALKYGSTNFAIVVRFDMLTYPLGAVWGGSLMFPLSEARATLDFLADLVPKMTADPKGMSGMSIGWMPDTESYAVWVVLCYLEPIAFAPLFTEIERLEPLASTLRVTHLVSLTDEVQVGFPVDVRMQWISLTLVPDGQMMLDLFRKGAEVFDPHRGRAGFTWTAAFQPVNVGLVAAGSRHGGNPTGLSPHDGDLMIHLATVTWEEPADDIVLKAAMQEYLAWARETAAQRGLLNRFIYLNYALGTQDVMSGVGSENRDELRRLQGIYDAQNMFRDYWVGGYKL
ncbi:hypothetical protein DFH09DRAFT_1464424 [Mycena vulgaris]|nr:hypothetical protein DFH09DRAFT_1464424 [Mycena vulgaris]